MVPSWWALRHKQLRDRVVAKVQTHCSFPGLSLSAPQHLPPQGQLRSGGCGVGECVGRLVCAPWPPTLAIFVLMDKGQRWNPPGSCCSWEQEQERREIVPGL